jgi:hypothetical protein
MFLLLSEGNQMSALYVISYTGQIGIGAAAIYVGRGRVVGIDVGNVRYSGSYEEIDGRLRGAITLEAKSRMSLVTGVSLSPGQKIQFTFDWPQNFASGQPQQLSVMGRAITVTVEKVGDVP